MTQDEMIRRAIEEAKFSGCGTQMMIYGLVIAIIILL